MVYLQSNLYYSYGQETQVTLNGFSTNKEISLLQTSYYGEISSITPQSSFGDEPIVIEGKAIDRESGTPLADSPLRLGITVDGFDRTYDVTTDSQGSFSYNFTPNENESGLYYVSLVHPDRKDKQYLDSFVIKNVSWSPANYSLRVPFDYQAKFDVPVNTGKDKNLLISDLNIVLKHKPVAKF